jgi:sodium-dependent dicarboxylate transporter 2/3/5
VTAGPSFGTRQRIGLVVAPLLFLVMLLVQPPGIEQPAWRTGALAAVMAVLWISEAIPISVTALLPLVLLPVMDVSDIEAAAAPYANSVIFLFMGGFMLARAMERWRLHLRIALWTMQIVGTRPRQMVGGMMAATGLISMWVSNTACTMMMLPIGLSVIQLVERNSGADSSSTGPGTAASRNFATAVLLGIAYAASIGGIGTLIGTPPNALFAGFIRETYGITIGFAQWMLVGVPIVIVALPVTWIMLTRTFPLGAEDLPEGRELVRRELAALGPISRGEWIVAGVFASATILWITRPFLADALPQLSDAGIAVAAAVALFLIPAEPKTWTFTLDWDTAKNIPWDVLVLFGGGLSLAAAISRTGLANVIGQSFSALDALPLVVVILVLIACICLLSELASNTATAATFLPVAAGLALGVSENPLLITTATAIGASLGFMLPVATPPNAIVYGTGRLTVPQMTRAGLALDIIGIILATVAVFALATWAFDIQLGVVPPWAAR